MGIKYDSRRESITEVVKKATFNATYVIPDLQRPFVWNASQVIRLVDSLFRGWPFGSLLLWEVKPDCFKENEGIPHRPFWQIVDRTKDDSGAVVLPLGKPATYQMVLDGQQRIQSLVLALGGDQWGFKLYDSDWALDVQGRRVRASDHWSKACLCLDLVRFRDEFKIRDNRVRKISVESILGWVVPDTPGSQSEGPRPNNYIYPLPLAKEIPGRFIRLSRIWELTQQGLSEGEYRGLLDSMLREHRVDEGLSSALIEPLAQFLQLLESIKNNSSVHALQIESFELTPQWSKDDYSDAIVNIFTRLNTAGRTLSQEEITLAWLKVGWLTSYTANKSAGQCLDELKADLASKGFSLAIDEVVRLISFIWAVENNNGRILDSKDLLKGEIVSKVASTISIAWSGLSDRIEEAAEFIKERSLIERQESFNSAIVFIELYSMATARLKSIADLQVVQRDSLEKELSKRISNFLDRWVFASQWANVWGSAAVVNFQNFADDLSVSYSELLICDKNNFLETFDKLVARLLDRVNIKAVEHVNSIVVRDRKRVHDYFPFLWIWHRLGEERWKNSSVPMRIGKRRISRLEVDHTIAAGLWGKLVEEEVTAKKAAFQGTEEERAQLTPDGFNSLEDALAFINLLGNCSLLDKTFNISKSIRPMWEFLRDVHEFQRGLLKRAEWERALSLDEKMTYPIGSKIDELRMAILTRDALIRAELVDFVLGKKRRVDIDE